MIYKIFLLLALVMPVTAWADLGQVYEGEFIVRRALSGAKQSADGSYQALRQASNGQTLIRYANNNKSSSELKKRPRRILRATKRLDQCRKILRLNPQFKDCSPNGVVKVALTPDDTDFTEQWGLASATDLHVQAEAAWDLATDASDVVVAVIDTGIDYTHPDLSANIWINPGEIADDGLDNDQNGIVDDVYGANFVDSNFGFTDSTDLSLVGLHKHGTHVAGIIGAVGNNSLGISGVAWSVQMMSLRVLNSNGTGDTMSIIEAVSYVTALKRDFSIPIAVINASLGGGSGDDKDALSYAIEEAAFQDITFVAAAGNNATNIDDFDFFPASYPIFNIIAVAATQQNGSIASFSNCGTNSVDIAAPGNQIYSTLPNNTYGLLSGTSMATPMVAGALALLHGMNPTLTAGQARDMLSSSADSYAGLESCVGGGKFLNVENLLLAAVPDATPFPTPRPKPTPKPSPTPKPTATPTPSPTPPVVDLEQLETNLVGVRVLVDQLISDLPKAKRAFKNRRKSRLAREQAIQNLVSQIVLQLKDLEQDLLSVKANYPSDTIAALSFESEQLSTVYLKRTRKLRRFNDLLGLAISLKSLI